MGGRGAETTVLLRFARLTIVEQGLQRALFSSKKRYAKKEQGCVTCSPLGRCTSCSVIVQDIVFIINSPVLHKYTEMMEKVNIYAVPCFKVCLHNII